MIRSIFSQILSGIACIGVGLLLLFILTSLFPLRGPKHLMPPSEGFYLRYWQAALFQYAFENEGRYPKELKELLGSQFINEKDPKRIDFIRSPNLRYFPPEEPISDPYGEKDKDKMLLIYETETWFFSITVGSNFEFRRKKEAKAELQKEELIELVDGQCGFESKANEPGRIEHLKENYACT